MITIHKSTDNGLEVVDQPAEGCWIQMIDPGAEETQQVAQELDIDPELLRFSLDPVAIPRAEKVGSALRILVRIPNQQRAGAKFPYNTMPLGILVTDDWVITICREKHDILRDLDDPHRADLSTNMPHRFVLHLL